jgi:type I restriction enzyme, S subunit
MKPNIPHHRLGDLCTRIFQGLSLSRHEGGIEVPVVLIRDIQIGRINAALLSTATVDAAAIGNYRIKPEDVLVSAKGTIGKAALVAGPLDGVLSSNLMALRPRPELIDPAYLYAYFATDHAARQLEALTRSSVSVKSIRAADLAALEIPLPDLATQQHLGRLALAFDEYQARTEQCLMAARTVLNGVMASRMTGKEGRKNPQK